MLGYHERTKHTPESVRTGPRGLDWEIEPAKFKVYPSLEAIALPSFEATGVPAHRAVALSAGPAPAESVAAPISPGAPATAETLSALLFFAAGVHRVVRRSFGDFAFRTYAAAGALYPDEVYLVTAALPGLGAGLYHYQPLEHSLRRVRGGDVRGNLAAAARRESLKLAPAALVITGIPWRTAWKYRARGYRHLFWDCGMLLANLLASAAARHVRAEVVIDFLDAEVNALLGLDAEREFGLALVPLGEGSPVPGPMALSPLTLDVRPLSTRELAYPDIESAHSSSSRRSLEEIWAGGDQTPLPPPRPPAHRRPSPLPDEGSLADDGGRVFETEMAPPDRLSSDGIEKVIIRRGSTRKLARLPMPAGELAAILDRALAGFPSDLSQGPLSALVAANALTGLAPGAYRYLGGGRFRQVTAGDMRGRAGYLCLEQQLGADAAAVVFLMARLPDYVQRLGGRGYRAAQLHAGVAAGRMYLGAYSQCLGASGITFYDDEVANLFGEQGWSPMLAVVVGPEGARRSIIRCRERRAQELLGG